ncbi:MAG TPA: riboflavin synthase [Bacteroidota bacterium]|nr:riboflavin synthase [Bacteroidota bacterium]
MFTGIITEIGKVTSVASTGGGVRLKIYAPQSSKELHIHDSISINGVCQTVIRKIQKSFEVEAVEETLKKTTFGSLKSNDEVNLELPLLITDRLGGHLVLGHVDVVGQVTNIERRESSWMFTITVPKAFAPYLAQTGSIAIDGVSLTIADLHQNRIRISIIPHTMDNTIFRTTALGDSVNVEFDIIGKYVKRLLYERENNEGEKGFLTEKYLREIGY